jgi:hypothetical protein
MRRLEQPDVSWRIALFIGFVLALLLLLLRTWQLAYLAGFVAGMLCARAKRAALIGGAGVALAWSGYLVFIFAFFPGQALSALTVEILGLGAGAWWLLPFLTIVLGLLVGAVGGLTGHAGAKLFLWSAPGAPESAKN